MPFPSLHTSPREREFFLYSPQERARVVYEYLFKGRSHRWLDINVLGKGSGDSLGWQAMGILHYLGIVKVHKFYFKDKSVAEAIQSLQEDGTASEEIIKYLRLYSATGRATESG